VPLTPSRLNARLQDLLLQASRPSKARPPMPYDKDFWGDQKNVDDQNDAVWGENKKGS